ncbi:hypothetical protein [Roseivirga pacifica]|uniref:hypothetical protein n=1 Tax=Roseivirga pacifica TaxID=1267423 RepID=UPI003BB08539
MALFKRKSKQEKFWYWFFKNEKTYLNEIENLDIREKIFDKLSVELKKVHEDLAFEFSPKHKSGIREFTISAEGDKNLFPNVQELIDKAPGIKNWQFNAFRQRVPGDDISIRFGDLEIGYDDIFFRYRDGSYGKIGIELNIRNFNDNHEIRNAVYILLDSLIGEFDVTMGIDWIDWVNLEEENIDDLNPITSLRVLIDQKKN